LFEACRASTVLISLPIERSEGGESVWWVEGVQTFVWRDCEYLENMILELRDAEQLGNAKYIRVVRI